MMGRLARELDDLGYLMTDPDPTDQRAIIVSLTDHGRRFATDAERSKAELERDYEALLGAGEPARLRHSLARLANIGSESSR